MSDMGDYGGGDYSGEQSFQTEEDFQRMLPGESEADWLKRLRGAGFKVSEFQGQGVPIGGQAAPGFTNWENQIGKTSGTGPGSSNLGGTTPEAMRRGAGGGGGPQSAGSSSYANTLADLLRANGGSGGGGGGGGQGGGMDQTGLHSNWSQGMGMGTMLSPMSNERTSSSGPGAVYDLEGMRLARSSRGDPGSMANVLRQLLFQRPTWINSTYQNQPNPYMGSANYAPAHNYLDQLMRSGQ